MASLEEDFPRGGLSKKPSESKTSKHEKHHAEVDNLFQVREPAVKKKKASQKQDGDKVTKKSRTEGGLKLNTVTNVDILQTKNLKVGTVVLGCVKEVSDFEVVLGLPSGLKGYLPISNICDAYTKILSESLDSGIDLEDVVSLSQLLTPGLLVRCVVVALNLSNEGFLSIRVSINPKAVNKDLSPSTLKPGMSLSGCVESVEDHGFLIDIGVSGTKAFLPKEKTKNESKSPKRDLKVGQYVTAVIEEVKNDGRVVRLSVDPSAINQAYAATQHGWTLSNLSPGLLVKTTIKKVTSHGLIVTFLSSFTGVVDFMHIDPDKAFTYNVGDEVKARILYVDSSSRTVGLSLRSHLLPPRGHLLDHVTSERIGEVLNGCKMVTVHHYSGAVMALPDGTSAFVNKNQMIEHNKEFNPNRLLAQPEHKLRIMDYSPMEQIFMATLRKKTIEKMFFSYQDIKPGAIIECTVQRLERYGMHVKITDHIKGLVPRIHLADVILNNPEKKYKEGFRVKCRVLSVDLANKKIVLTRKKTLLETPLPLFFTYADARVGLESHGFIVCVKEFGCIVRFFGEVKGLVPTQELITDTILNPQSLFYVGQVVKARVLKCDPENSRLLLSLKAETRGDIQSVKFDFEIGKKVEAKVLRKNQTGLEVSILPEEAPAVLPMVHLSDHVTNSPLLWESIEEGDIISKVVCLSKNKQRIVLSKKPLLTATLEAGNLASSFSELHLGMVMVGWVKSILPYGVFVDFPHGLFGLAPKSAMSDRFITETVGVFEIGQTVLAKITNLDKEKSRFLISLKVSEVCWEESEAQARLIQGQRERKTACDMKISRGDAESPPLLSASLGDKLEVTVGEVTEDGSVTLTSDQLRDVTVVASKYHSADVDITPGSQVDAVVLHLDLLTSVVHVSLSHKLTGKKKKLKEGSQHTATVEFSDEDFAVVSLGDTGHLTVVSVTTHPNETFRFESEQLSVGRELTVTVMDPKCEHLDGRALVNWKLVVAKRERRTSECKGERHTHKVGDLVTALVKSVKPACVLVTLPDGITGSVHVSQIFESPKVGSFPTSSLKAGTEVKGRVIGGREVQSHKFLPISHSNFIFTLPELTLLPSKLLDGENLPTLDNEPQLEDYKPGEELTCYISKYVPEAKCLELAVSPNVTGSVELLALISKPREAVHPQKCFKLGQCVSAKVVGLCTKQPQRLRLSLTGIHALKPGVVTMGMVSKICPHKGLILKLPFKNFGSASITDLSDTYTENPLEQYKEGQVVRCCIIGEEDGKFHASLRLSRIHAGKNMPVTDVEINSVSELEEGQIIQGYVKDVGQNGIFVRLSRSITGRVQFQHTTNFFVNDPDMFSEHISQNALLTAKVLRVDTKTNHVDLSLLPEDTGKSDILPESLNLKPRLKGKEKEKYDKIHTGRKRKISESKQDEALQIKKAKKEENAQKKEKKKRKQKKTQAEDQDSGVEVYFREEETVEPKKKAAVPTEPSRLQVTSDFSWDAALSSLKPAPAAPDEYGSSDDERDDQNKTVKKSRRAVEQERKEAELKLSRLEAQLMEPSARPESTEAFERLLLSSPDSSLLWLQYMAFQLQATQIEQARCVAERALKTISFREEQEKLNVWVALLNLENMYGTDESLQKVFERAIQYCEPMAVYQQLADIYTNSDKLKEAESLYKNMLKRFRQEKAVWQSYGSFLLRQGQSDAANALLQRALQSLSNKEHVDLIVKFARLEFQYGNAERAKAMFDKVLSSYPKRTDLWSIFIDIMVKHGSQKDVRALFDRVINLSVSVKKIKFFFKRYLDYEKRHGTPESIQSVKHKALEYVESKGTEAAS